MMNAARVIGSAAVCAIAFFAHGISVRSAAAEPKKEKPKEKPVAGKADVLRHVPKKFATYLGHDADKGEIRLRVQGEKESTVWKIHHDAEIKVHGWWGRLDQLHGGDRVWVWFTVDRKKQPTGILMLADEISEQDIHGVPYVVKAVNPAEAKITIEKPKGDARTLKVVGSSEWKPGEKVYVQSAGEAARLIWNQKELDAARSKQRDILRKMWREQGLPGTVTFAHPLSGEMEVMLDHEAIRWGRYLKYRDEVQLIAAETTKAVVKQVQPWRERTRLRLVTNSGLDQTELAIGQRVHVKVPEPPADVQQSDLPTDIGRERRKVERAEWFLATVYCPCKVAGDRCTGMFYTLSSCNMNACGMPNFVRSKVTKMIDDGLTDEQILAELISLRGADLRKQHLLK